jgi:hypothetical protein
MTARRRAWLRAPAAGLAAGLAASVASEGVGGTTRAELFEAFGPGYADAATRCLSGVFAGGARDAGPCLETLVDPCADGRRDRARWADRTRCLQVLASLWRHEARRQADSLDALPQPGTGSTLFARFAVRTKRAEARCRGPELPFGLSAVGAAARHQCSLLAAATLAHIVEHHPERLTRTAEERPSPRPARSGSAATPPPPRGRVQDGAR